jgi:hypothetical protein
MENILLGKFGKSVKFKKSSWTLKGGDAGIYNLIILLTKNNPDKRFFLCGVSDYNKLTESEKQELFPHNNFVYLNNIVRDYQSQMRDLREKNITLHGGIIMMGMLSNCSIPGVSQKVDRSGTAKVLNYAERYISPIVHILNETKIPFYTISEDPRNMVQKSRDLIHREKFCLGLDNDKYKARYYKSFEEQFPLVEKEIEVKFSPINLLQVYGMRAERNIEKSLSKKDLLLNIFMNKFGLDSKTTRKPFVEEYILSNFPNAKIYGLWDEDDGFRFENKKMSDIPDILERTKYTVIYSLKPGFISGKPYEMITQNIIPFLHPKYDFKRHLDFPDFLYLESPTDLVEKINYLENDKDYYFNLVTELNNRFLDSYTDGTFLSSYLFSELEK